ncbi:MAG: hydroxymethylglutaryl-CoA synthase [Myxococcaceae bacterium]|nr:hydroxymethylglutaryl-CoA synthase [Myxococcaceae bacterium]
MTPFLFSVGIDAFGVAVPKTFVSLTKLAQARGVDPQKYLGGLGTELMGIAMPDEDTVTLAARAAHQALESSNTRPEDIGMLVVGTETAVDHSKPVASFVQGLLGIGPRCRVFETKHACYGGTAALQLAADWIRSGSAKGQKALVICSDIARYGLHTPGEPTQGAGAVALLISSSPRLLALEPGQSGLCSMDVHDFWRPLYSKDALVDGHYSVQCYLDALSGAYADYQANAGTTAAPGTLFSDRFAAFAYHVPYGKMARKAHRQIRTLDGDATPDESFERLVGASLRLPSLVGNIYTGSLYLAVVSLLDATKGDLTGQRLGLFSYGSGACAEFFSAVVQPGAQAAVQALGLSATLARRRELSIDEYEAVMRTREALDEKPLDAAKSAFAFQGIAEHRRTYARPS